MDRRYSLRTCAIIITLAVLISWAPFVGLWLWMQPSGGFSPDLPPKEYRGDAKVTVHFTRHAEVLCKIIKADGRPIACAPIGGDLIIAPNPCDWKSDAWARLMCHESGHTQGWAADHPR